MEKSLQVAQTISDQIGHQAMFMMGAKNLLGTSNSLQFQISGSKVANIIKVRLNSLDTYEVVFWKVRGLNFKIVATVDGVYADQLRRIIEKNTGLATRL